MSQFSVDFSKFVASVPEKADLIRKKTFIEVGRRIIQKTPVDIGAARNGWQTDVNTVPTSDVFRPDPAGTAAISELITSVARSKPEDTVNIANNRPYIIPLEHGHSKQAPAGMVGITIAEFPYILSENAKAGGFDD